MENSKCINRMERIAEIEREKKKSYPDIKRYGTEEEELELEVYNTSLEEKADNFDNFVELIRNQFMHGGDKYQLAKDKEMTDLICEMFPGKTGVDWVLGTIVKYAGRFKNFEREKDLLKMVTYLYIIWLKKGFHLCVTHDEDIRK